MRIVERLICNTELEIDVEKGNEIFIDKDLGETLPDTELNTILTALANRTGSFQPLSLFWELTNECNFCCPFCYIHTQNHMHHTPIRFVDVKTDIDYLIHRGLLACLISGGECLLNRDFHKIYRYLKENGVMVSVFTNGSLIDDATFALFSELKPYKIEISIYANTEDDFQRTTQQTKVSNAVVYENVLKLKSLGIDVACKTPITQFTQHSYRAIREWCEKYGILHSASTVLIPDYEGQEKKQYLADHDLRAEFQKEIEKELIAPSFVKQYRSDIRKTKMAFDCRAGLTDFMITSRYTITPCMKSVRLEHLNFDIRESGIESAIKRLEDFLGHAKGQPLEYCKGCHMSLLCNECYMTEYDFTSSPALQSHREKYCKELQEFYKSI